LYSKYGLTRSEIEFVERTVRPMDLSVDPGDEVVAEIDDDE